jgi:hypothetical protein
MNTAISIIQRIISTFIVNAMAIVTGSALLGVDIAKGAIIAGFSAVAQVVERLARSSVDGKLTTAEINAAFTGVVPSDKEDK